MCRLFLVLESFVILRGCSLICYSKLRTFFCKNLLRHMRKKCAKAKILSQKYGHFVEIPIRAG